MHTIEWAPFSLAPNATEAQLLAASAAIQPLLQAQPAYQSRQLLKLGAGRYADMLHWRSQHEAQETLAALLDTDAFRHYFALMQTDAAPIWIEPLFTHAHTAKSIQGLEFSLFRLRPGISETSLMHAAQHMAASLYQGQPGFEAHMIMRNETDPTLLADVVLADSAQHARALCGRWGQGPFHPDCQDYLDMIDPTTVQLAFWSRVE
ncbi:hypothetical protein E9531_01170 [Lampropedia puyangensis]|uniref:ABM domain-containing protein n=1 Tax=Lampropedia puyangensis TaxID=1330072 RepID=A0A4V4GSE4_9BURK|nr:hypothetical protein [Lampropedia puyangensis]THU05196.1 hypothetical protein E9531_01170 [Lampropedia puyangensis]